MENVRLEHSGNRKTNEPEIIPFTPAGRKGKKNNPTHFEGLKEKIRHLESELAIAKSNEAHFRKVFDHLFQFIGILDPKGRVIEANKRVSSFAGLEHDKIVGKNFWLIGLLGRTPSRVRAIRDMVQKAGEGEMVRKELSIEGCPGQSLTIDFSITPVFDDEGNVTMLIPEARDISTRKMMENSLRDSEAYYHSLFEQAHDAILIFDPHNEKVLDVNPAACELYGFTRIEFLHISLEQVTQDVRQGKTRIRELVENGSISNYETKHFRKDGTEMVMEVNATLFPFHGQQAVLCVMRDVTERKHYESQLLRAALHAQDMERRRFSTELHDGLGQLLSATRMQFQFLVNAKERLTEKEITVLDASLTILQRAMQEVRSISWNMMPASLERFGLVVCLEELAEMIMIASGVQVTINCEGILAGERFPAELELGIFRIIQELIHNAIKHAQPEQIDIDFICDNKGVRIEVVDNGAGFPASENRKPGTGNGLSNLRSRVKLLGGTIVLSSKAGKGTRVKIDLPKNQNKDGND